MSLLRWCLFKNMLDGGAFKFTVIGGRDGGERKTCKGWMVLSWEMEGQKHP